MPSTRPKAPSQLVPAAKKDTLIAGMEIYTDKNALSTQQQESWFKEFAERGEKEGLLSAKDELVAWYPTTGFVSRGDGTVTGEGIVVMIAVFTCKEGGREKVVEVIG